MTDNLQEPDGVTFDPAALERARAVHTEARLSGAAFASIRRADLEQLLARIDFGAKAGEQLAEKCAAYRTQIEELEAKLDRDGNELRDRRTDLLNIRGILHPADRPDFCAVPVELMLGKEAAPAIEWLVARVDQLTRDPRSWDEWAVHYDWADGTSQTDPHNSRAEAEEEAALDPQYRAVVRRTWTQYAPIVTPWHGPDAEDPGAAAAAVDEDQADTQPLPVAADAIQMHDVDGTTVYTQPTTFSVTAVPEDPYDAMHWEIQVQYTGAYYFGQTKPENQRWAVRMRSWCLSDAGTWDHEPIPSEREEDWLATHRFDYATALRLAAQHATKVEINGYTVADALARQAARANANKPEVPRA